MCTSRIPLRTFEFLLSWTLAKNRPRRRRSRRRSRSCCGGEQYGGGRGRSGASCVITKRCHGGPGNNLNGTCQWIHWRQHCQWKKRDPSSGLCCSCCDCISTWADDAAAVVDLDSFVHPVGLLHMLEHGGAQHTHCDGLLVPTYLVHSSIEPSDKINSTKLTYLMRYLIQGEAEQLPNVILTQYNAPALMSYILIVMNNWLDVNFLHIRHRKFQNHSET